MTDRSLLRARVRQYLTGHAITAQCYVVALALIARVNRRGTAWPSEATIAADAGCSERSVRRHKLTLERIGLLRWARRRRTSCLYRLSAPPIWRDSIEKKPLRDSAARLSGLKSAESPRICGSQISPQIAGALARLGAAIGVPAGAVMPWLMPVRPN